MEQSRIKISLYWLLVPLAIIFISRLLPFLLYGPHPLGYDTGFYNHAIEAERLVNPPALRLDDSGTGAIFKALVNLGLSNQAILYFLPVLITAFIGLAIFFLIRLYFSEQAAFFSMLIYSLSFTQYLVYWEMFWKNTIGLFLMLLIFYFLEMGGAKKLFLAVIPAITLLFIHKTSFFILALTVFCYLLAKKNKYKYLILSFIILLSLVGSFIYKDSASLALSQIFNSVKVYDFFSLKSGIFLSGFEYLKLSWHYLILAFIPIFSLIRKKDFNLILVLAFLSLILIIFKFIFYERLTIYLDLALIMLAGAGLEAAYLEIKKRCSSRISNLFVIIFICLSAGWFFYLVAVKEPLLSQKEFSSIEAISGLLPRTMVFSYDSNYTPWLYGFSGHKIFSPGWGDAGWNLKNWQEFWQATDEEKIVKLGELPQPLLIYKSDELLNVNSGRFKKINGYFYYFNE